MSDENKQPSTISDIAQRSGVSNRTVSRVINRSSKVGEATREKVQRVIDELSYRPNAQARGLAGGRSYLLGLIYDNPDALFIDEAQRGVLNVCRELGYELVIHPCGETDTLASEVVGSVKRSKLDGVIVLPPLSEDHNLFGALAQEKVPYVRLASVALDTSDRVVVSNERSAVAAMAEYLVELGHRRIGPVIVIDDENDAEPLAEALLAGGLDLIEVTLRTAAAAAALGRILRRFPEMLVGAGTVVTREQAERCLDLGVSFGVAPGFNPETVRLFAQRGVPFMPGVLTPSEIEAAYGHGCTLLKFFPAEAAGGPKMLRALAAPYESLGIRFCPTGGVSVDNMKEYLSLPQVFAVGGSWLASKRQIAEKQWNAITQQTREALSRAREVAP